jgi:hypothetical protein
MVKYIISVILCFTAYAATAQTRLCEEKTVMYSICYELNDNGRFHYQFSHCTGLEHGTGTYIKKGSRIEFQYEKPSVSQIAVSSVACVDSFNSSANENKITISIYQMIDSLPVEFASIRYKGLYYSTDTNGTFQINYDQGDIMVAHYSGTDDKLILNPLAEGCSTYKVYVPRLSGDTYLDSDKLIVMHKKGNRYYVKQQERKYSKRFGYEDTYRLVWRTHTYKVRK